MMVSVFALTASATDDDPGAEPEEDIGIVNPQTPLWYRQPIFDYAYEENDPAPVPNGDVLSGRNTVQKIATFNGEYFLIIHPQYFHDVLDPTTDNYDDEDNAISFLTIVDLLVYDTVEEEYVTCLNGSLARFSTDCLQINSENKEYFQFIVELEYVNLVVGEKYVKHLTWEPAYLDISDFDIMTLEKALDLEEPTVGIDPTDAIWFQDEYFTIEESGVVMPINHTLSGRNTVQKIADLTDFDGNYYLVIHPQYFEDGWNPDDYDNQNAATQILAIVDLLVYSPAEEEYVTCLNGSLAKFSTDYLQYNDDHEPKPYLQFIVALDYVDIINESVSHFTWKEAYLKFAEFDIA
jgi:hypothetical protein